jgi:hypothetical protein
MHFVFKIASNFQVKEGKSTNHASTSEAELLLECKASLTFEH